MRSRRHQRVILGGPNDKAGFEWFPSVTPPRRFWGGGSMWLLLLFLVPAAEEEEGHGFVANPPIGPRLGIRLLVWALVGPVGVFRGPAGTTSVWVVSPGHPWQPHAIVVQAATIVAIRPRDGLPPTCVEPFPGCVPCRKRISDQTQPDETMLLSPRLWLEPCLDP